MAPDPNKFVLFLGIYHFTTTAFALTKPLFLSIVEERKKRLCTITSQIKYDFCFYDALIFMKTGRSQKHGGNLDLQQVCCFMPNNLRKNLSSITDTILICFVWVSCVYFWYFGMFFRVVKVNIFKPRFNFRYQTASCSATTRLERGATVYVQLVKGELFGHSYLFSTFTGYKLS